MRNVVLSDCADEGGVAYRDDNRSWADRMPLKEKMATPIPTFTPIPNPIPFHSHSFLLLLDFPPKSFSIYRTYLT